VNELLLGDLRRRLDFWSNRQRLGDIFTNLVRGGISLVSAPAAHGCAQAPVLKMYTNYCDRFDGALQTLSECEKNKDFAAFLAVRLRTLLPCCPCV
jgi:hypothetical protein